MQKSLDILLEEYEVQPVGCGYIDCIILKNNLVDFVNAITGLGIKINSLSLWCHCSEMNKQKYDCPHGMGGPKSDYYEGYFSEMCDLSIIDIKNNEEVITYVFDTWINDERYSPCIVPALWLEVPKEWRNKKICNR